MKSKVIKMKLINQLIGVKLPTNIDGHAGRALEKILESAGIKINRGAGPDILIWGIEVKTRKKSATSPQTIASMSPDDIISTSYYRSNVYKKFQQQLRIKTDDNDVIIEADLYDFDQPQIQQLIAEAYEHGRKLISQNKNIKYTPYEGYWGYFEQTKPGSDCYDFRVSDSAMESLERMAKSTFTKHFEVL
jgi:homoserine dehydrogenase